MGICGLQLREEACLKMAMGKSDRDVHKSRLSGPPAPCCHDHPVVVATRFSRYVYIRNHISWFSADIPKTAAMGI